MSTLPSFIDVANALDTLSSLGTAAESHGLLCALLSLNTKVRQSAWVDSLLTSHIETGNAHAEAAYQCLTDLFQHTANGFDPDHFDFPLLIPDDDQSLGERIDALSEWCQGYLTGLHLMGFKLEGPIESADLKEAIDDLLAISQVELTPEDEKDAQSEVRFMELVEHVKAAVLIIISEFKERPIHGEHTVLH